MSRVRSYNELLQGKKKGFRQKEKGKHSKSWSNKMNKNFWGLSYVFVKKKFLKFD